MSTGASRDSLASSIAFSGVPPRPRPSIPGGHQPAPRVGTVLSTQSTTDSLGLRTANRALFSDPPPLAAIATSTRSPATSSAWTIAGVLSLVLTRPNSGWPTIEARNGLSGWP